MEVVITGSLIVHPNCEICVPDGLGFGIQAVGSTTAHGWIEMIMLLPLLSACEIATPAKPTTA
jgi:hypothetical protein